MKSKWSCSQAPRARAINLHLRISLFAAICALLAVSTARADAPPWMHSLTSVPLPAHDEKTNAVLLYSEENVNVISTDKIKINLRRAYKILRPEGREEYGTIFAHFRSPGEKVNGMRAWCIPAQGKDYEVRDKEAVESSYPKIAGSELISDLRVKLLRVPAADPGNIVGYEYEIEEQPLVLQEEWVFQHEIPVRESRYSVQLPPGWEYKAAFLNHAEIKPIQVGNQWQWVITDVKGIRVEPDMPPFGGVVGQMVVSLFPPGSAARKGFSNWSEMGVWYLNLESGRAAAAPEIQQKVASLTASSHSTIEKMNAVAKFVQDEVRYVAIELGIGGWQPHPARDIFLHRYGDCKDKATLMRAMLQEIGVNSYQVAINTERGSITQETPAYLGFNHQIIAIQLPDGVNNPPLMATIQHPKYGTLLFFDPTDELTPFGEIRGGLQANYGLLITPETGELVELPKQPAGTNSIRRTGKLTLDPAGNLQGEIEELRLGDRASSERWRLRTVASDSDRVKPIESLLAGSLSNYVITKAIVENLNQTSLPFGFKYSFVARSYAKQAGDMVLVRPRVLGTKARNFLETKEPRQFPVEFEGPVQDTDIFEIALPVGYEVDDLPPPVDADFSFASYHSKTEAKGNVISYSRTFEVKELSVPVSKAEELKRFYRIIASDERNTAVLKTSK